MVMLKISTKPNSYLLFLFILLLSFEALAQSSPMTTSVLDTVLNQYQSSTGHWKSTFLAVASRLFWSLTAISMTWTFGQILFKKDDINDLFAEFIRQIVFTGFFWWLLTNGPEIAQSIVESLRNVASQAIGSSGKVNPSNLIDMGFHVVDRSYAQAGLSAPIDALVGIVVSFAILICCTLIAVNVTISLISVWILSYAGIIFLGFGGSRWTSDFAITYYKTVLGVAAKVMTLILLVGIGNDIIDRQLQMLPDGMSYEQLSVLLVLVISLLMLTNKVPDLVGSIASANLNGTGQAGMSSAVTSMMIVSQSLGHAAKGLSNAAKNMSGASKAFTSSQSGTKTSSPVDHELQQFLNLKLPSQTGGPTGSNGKFSNQNGIK